MIDTNQFDFGDYLHSVDAEPQDFGVVIMERLIDQSYQLTVTWYFATRMEAKYFMDAQLLPFYLESQCAIASRENWQEDVAQLREHFKKINTEMQVMEYDRATRRYYKQILP